MRETSGQSFTSEYDRGGFTLEHVRFVKCTFTSCGLSLVGEPAAMARVTRVELVDCASINSTVGPCHLTDVTVTNLRTGDLTIVWGPLLTRVTLVGKVGSLKINDAIHAPRATEAEQRAFRRLRAAHYATVDWALDISRARCLSLDIHGIPAGKIRRDPDTQIVIRREQLHRAAQLESVRGLDENTRFILESFVEGERADVVLVAPIGRAAKYYKPVLASFAALRAAGLADPG